MPDILAFDRDALAGAAERIFFSFPGIRAMIAGTGDASCPESDRGGGNATDCKPGRRPDGRRIFRCTATDEMFAIRDRRFADLAAKAAFAPIPLSSFQNRCFDLDGRMICCEGFSAVRPHTAMGIYFCMATVGNDHAGGANDAGGANGGM
ncbi:MAG: hypothetical protein LBO81_06915, partial [Clostridiales Family XIII bacterium]|nr:hypothetical protein [Clostridiales Family XIII bacterium]